MSDRMQQFLTALCVDGFAQLDDVTVKRVEVGRYQIEADRLYEGRVVRGMTAAATIVARLTGEEG
jgi:hypothetical protein